MDAFYFDTVNGIWNIDDGQCIGCGTCAEECPFGAIIVHQDSKSPFKCDLCKGDPACVKSCPTGALKYDSETDVGAGIRVSYTSKITNYRSGE